MHAFDNGAAQRQAAHWKRANGLDKPEIRDATREVIAHHAEDAGETVVVVGRVVTEHDLRDAVTLFRDLGVVLALAYEVEDVSEDEAAARNHVAKLVQTYVDQLPPETPAEAHEAIREHLSRIAH